MNETGFIEGLILSVIFVVCLLLVLRHIKRAFSADSGCGDGCGGCSSAVTKKACPSNLQRDIVEPDETKVSIEVSLSEQYQRER